MADSVVSLAEKASKIPLYGGAVVFGTVVLGVYKKNTDGWIIGQNLMIWALVLTAVCVIVGGAIRMYALKRRADLLEKGIDLEKIKVAIPEIMLADFDPAAKLALLELPADSEGGQRVRRIIESQSASH